MYRCLVRYDTLCHLTLVYGSRLLDNNPFLPDQCYYYVMIFPDYIMNALTFSNFLPLSAKKGASAMTFPDCINPDFCEVIATSIRRTWRKILDFLVRKFSVGGQLLHIFEQIARKSAKIWKMFSPEN